MIKKYSLVLVVLLCSFFYGYGQCLTDDFNSGYGNWTGFGTYQNTTAGVTGNGTGFNSTGDEIITNSVLTNPQTLTLWLARSSSTANKTFSIQYSTSNSGPWTSARDILVGEVTTTHQEFTVNLNLTGDYYIRIAMTQRSGGSYYLDDIEVTCSASCTDTLNYNNLQSPASGTITVGGAFNVYAQAFEPGVTDAAGQGAGVETWIGYSSADTDPSGSGWNWVVATYNTDVGNNDEYVADIGSAIATSGTYYYASRFRLNSCGYTYGGYNGGTWDGTTNVSGVLTVNPDQVDFCNVDFPKTGNITTGDNFSVYAQAYEPGVTDAAGQGANIQAWIGYNTIGINHQPWDLTGWTWVVATYDSDVPPGNNDQYVAEIGSGLPAGTYYYASRFQLNGSDFSYGGIQFDNVGNFWDATNNNGTLTITNPPNNATDFEGCFQDTSVDLTWTAPASGTTPDGYVIFAIAGGTAPTGAKLDAITYTANSDFSAAPTETPASLGKVVYKGVATAATVTGLTEGSNYSFAVFAYNNESSTGWSSGSVASRILNGFAQDDIRNLTSTPNNNQVTLNWLRPTPLSCWDEIVIFANQGVVTITPSGDGSAYTANSVYTTANQAVYKGGATSVAITGLTNGTSYCFKAYVRRGTTWSDGIEICETPEVTYCDSDGNEIDGYITLIRNVEFNTINNASSNADNNYSDYTAISTTVTLGDTHNLTVQVNTDGAFTTTTIAWIDWNNDGDFNDSNEDYPLGNAFNVENGATDLSPLAIEIPTNAVIGSTRMRISTKYDTTAATPCEDDFDGEVEDYTINIVQPIGAEMNIKGNNITIANGFNAPYGLNNTLFGAVDVGGPFNLAKTYTVENIGAAALTLSGTPRVEIIGTNGTANAEFTVTLQPAGSVASSGTSTFDIQFTPLADGLRTATVRIVNSDSDENPYEFDIEGTATCSIVLTSTIWPTEGPEDTEVTITSATSLTGATADINGVNMPIISTSPTELIVTVPAGASTGNLSVNFSTGCSSTNTFTIIETVIGGCENGASTTTPTDLFMSEISDATSGSSSYIEIYNGTGGAIDLSDYDIKIYNNGSNSASSTNSLIGTLANGAVYLVTIGTTSCALNDLNVTPDQTFNSSGGINFNINSSDAIVLEKISGTNQGEKDIFGVKGSNTWANGLSFGTDGVNFRRKNDAPNLPTMTFALADWDIIDWTNCGDSSYSDFGFYDFSLGIPPNITLQPIAPVSNCDLSASLTVNATEGVVAGLSLAYQWYVLAPNQTTWSLVTNGALYNNAGTNTLQLLNMLNLDGYQYYCQVRENTVTCYTASNAIKLTVQTTEWDGASWSNGIPDINTIATINGDYNTSVGGQDSFSACSLIINNVLLTIDDNDYVEVQNDLTINGANGAITVQPQGAFVQINDNSNVTATVPNNITVNKLTAPANNWYEYTYWSSPVVGETVANGLAESNPNRRFEFQAQNYRDSEYENMNDNTMNSGAGIDDIDDYAPYDWQNISTTNLIPGVGYASTHTPGNFEATPGCPGPTCRINYTFNGLFNNGIITVPLYRNDEEPNDNNWNFIGNPYPSAIDADAFLSTNTGLIDETIPAPNPVIDGAIYLWSQNTAPSGTTNGNENLNFSQSDYAIINGTGQTAAQSNGGDSEIPTRNIPSGQGFFISMSDSASPTTTFSDPTPDPGTIETANVIFNNAMRVRGATDNSQFFRNSNTDTNNKIWINLKSDNGVFSQILVGYLSNATDGNDGMYFDAPRNFSTGANSIIYSIITDSDKKFAIQGKDPNSLNLDEIIPLGFYTSIDEATLYTFSIEQLEGDFLTNNTIYLKDNVMNVIHDLSDSDYTFTSDVGEFNERFEIVFNREALSVGENELDPNDLTIVELNDTEVKFTVGNNFQIKSVEIIDLLGRTIYRLQGTSSSEIYNLSNLSKSAYIAKVELSNGQIITKKAIKRH